jgi:hypothetical protein
MLQEAVEVKRDKERPKVRNIDNFMEELRREQEAREERAKRREQRVRHYAQQIASQVGGRRKEDIHSRLWTLRRQTRLQADQPLRQLSVVGRSLRRSSKLTHNSGLVKLTRAAMVPGNMKQPEVSCLCCTDFCTFCLNVSICVLVFPASPGGLHQLPFRNRVPLLGCAA